MSGRAFLSTRKGLFELRKVNGRGISAGPFLGKPVSMALPDPRDGSLYAALNLGHFGVKLHRRYDLVYRHGLAVSGDGRTLLMGSTTGGVWISENGGDSWHTVSTTLPPVYMVSFG